MTTPPTDRPVHYHARAAAVHAWIALRIVAVYARTLCLLAPRRLAIWALRALGWLLRVAGPRT